MDEVLSNAECKAIAEADEWLKHNEPIPHEEILAEFGLTAADWERMGAEAPPEGCGELDRKEAYR